MSQGKKNVNKYPKELKLQAVQRVMNGEHYKKVSEELNITTPTTIHKWIRQYKQTGEQAFESTLTKEQEIIRQQAEKIKELEMKLALEKKLQEILAKEEAKNTKQ